MSFNHIHAEFPSSQNDLSGQICFFPLMSSGSGFYPCLVKRIKVIQIPYCSEYETMFLFCFFSTREIPFEKVWFYFRRLGITFSLSLVTAQNLPTVTDKVQNGREERREHLIFYSGGYFLWWLLHFFFWLSVRCIECACVCESVCVHQGGNSAMRNTESRGKMCNHV